MKKIVAFIRREPVLSAAGLLMALSAIAVPPDAGYRSYIDVRTLGLLFALMASVGELRELGVFDRLSARLMHTVKTERGLMLLLVLLPFFLSMLVTNDVSLITLVPLILTVLGTAAPNKRLIAVALATVAANLGSAATPFGNPQNLYLTSRFSVPAGTFFLTLLPLIAISLVLTASLTAFVSKRRPVNPVEAPSFAPMDKKRLALAAALFLINVSAVMRFVPWTLTAAVTLVALLIVDRRAFMHVDVGLLVTFVFFFIFVGNIARIPSVKAFVEASIAGRALPISALFSQVISNVPAALMLSSFTSDFEGLLLGTNIGGLGTPIASMASLISLRFILKDASLSGGRYLLLFSILNFGLLALLLSGFCLIR